MAEVEIEGAVAVFTGRSGGFSSGPFASLNLGGHVGDDPIAVAANRQHLGAAVGVSDQVAMTQVHGTNVINVTHGFESAIEHRSQTIGEADVMVTSLADVGLIALTADCMPIALGTADAVAVIHAGWRGLAAGVVENAVSALMAVSQHPVAAVIGPCAGPCCYEVSDEVLGEFDPPAVANGRMLDLGATAELRLRAVGVSRVRRVSICTICDAANRFYSHRRDGVPTGRQGVIAWLNS